MKINTPARITPQEGGGFLVQFVDLPDTFTEGQTLEEALFNAAEVLSAMVGWHLDQGSNIPAPDLPACWASVLCCASSDAGFFRIFRSSRTVPKTNLGVRNVS